MLHSEVPGRGDPHQGHFPFLDGDGWAMGHGPWQEVSAMISHVPKDYMMIMTYQKDPKGYEDLTDLTGFWILISFLIHHGIVSSIVSVGHFAFQQHDHVGITMS